MTYIAVLSGADHVCAIRSDHSVACWGANQYGQSTPPSDRFTAISATLHYSCGIRLDQTLTCRGHPRPLEPGGFGDDDHGQHLPPAGSFRQISSGRMHSCGVGTDGSAICWNYNGQDQVAAPAGSFLAVTVGAAHSCGLQSDHTIRCWGYNSNRQINAPAGSFTHLDAGDYYTCASRDDGVLTCWGANYNGESSLPLWSYRVFSAEGFLTCAIDTQERMVCQGYNGPDLHPPTGATDPLLGRFLQVSSGGGYKCALRTDGTISCSGDAFYDQFPVPEIRVAMEQAAAVTRASRPLAGQTALDLSFSATGGAGQHAFRLIGGALPDGLTLNGDGSVSGTTSDMEPHYVEVEAIDQQQVSGAQGFFINLCKVYLPSMASATAR